MAVCWYNNGYYDNWDIFFDTDPDVNLNAFAHGSGKLTSRHPLVAALTLPIRLIALVVAAAGLVSDEHVFRELLALGVCPLCSALSLIYYYKILILLKVKALDAKIFTFIFGACFSNILFAIIPETFALSCLLSTALVHYYLWCKELKSSGNTKVWVFLGVFLAGVTISNICIFFIIFYLHLVRNETSNHLSAFKKASTYSVLSLALAVFLFKSVILCLGVQEGFNPLPTYVKNWTVSSIGGFCKNIFNLCLSSIHSFFGFFSKVKYNKHIEMNSFTFICPLRAYKYLAVTAAISLAFLIYTAKYIKLTRWRELYLISILIIGYNFLLHSIFGREMFLYSQHWILPLNLLLLPILSQKRVLSVSCLILMIIINIDFFLDIEQKLFL